MRFSMPHTIMLVLFALFILGYSWLPEARWHKNLYYLTLLSTVPLLFQHRQNWREWISPLTISLFIFMLYQIVSLSWGSVYSPQELGELARKVVLTASFVGIGAVAIARVSFQSSFWLAGIVAFSLTALWALIGWYIGDNADAMERLMQLGRGENANAAGAIIGVGTIACFASLIFATERLKRSVLLCCWLACALALVATQSRGAWLAAAAGHAVLLGFTPALSRKSVAMISLAVIALLLVSIEAIDWEMIIARADGHRLFVWQQALESVTLLGQGYRTPFEAVLPYGETIYQVHSIYVKALYDGGIIGALLLVALLAMAGLTLWQKRHYPRAILGLALWANAVMFGMVDFDILWVNSGIEWLLFWLPVAMAVATSRDYR